MIIIHTTIGSEEDARELTNYLVKKQLIACGTFHEIQSIYKWKDEIQEESEYEINLYSKESLHDQLIETLKEKLKSSFFENDVDMLSEALEKLSSLDFFCKGK